MEIHNCVLVVPDEFNIKKHCTTEEKMHIVAINHNHDSISMNKRSVRDLKDKKEKGKQTEKIAYL